MCAIKRSRLRREQIKKQHRTGIKSVDVTTQCKQKAHSVCDAYVTHVVSEKKLFLMSFTVFYIKTSYMMYRRLYRNLLHRLKGKKLNSY